MAGSGLVEQENTAHTTVCGRLRDHPRLSQERPSFVFTAEPGGKTIDPTALFREAGSFHMAWSYSCGVR